MSKSALLRVRDVCAAYRLIGECRDLGGDPARWQPRALEGLRCLVGGFAATGGEGMWLRPDGPLQPITTYDLGFEGIGRDRFFAYFQDNGLLADPVVQQIQQMEGRTVTCSRREIVPDRDWYRSISFNEYRKPAGCDHQISSIHRVSEQGAVTGLFLHRERGERDFSSRELRLMHFFHLELGRLVGGALVSALEPGLETLSPRLRQTLTCLLDGDSEKAIASRLGVSHSTAHQYVTMLYRKFGVRSRGHLMAHVHKRLQRSGRLPC